MTRAVHGRCCCVMGLHRMETCGVFSTGLAGLPCYGRGMGRLLRNPALRAAAFLAVLAQTLLSGLASAGAASGMDGAGFWCAPYGPQPSPAAERAVQAVMALDGDSVPSDGGDTPPGGHCPLCIAAHAMPLAVPVALDPPAAPPADLVAPLGRIAATPYPQGPPLGGRAPPVSA